ncbi:MAG: DinB family protein [Bacteroidota bacterium]
MTVHDYLTYFDEMFRSTEPLFRMVPPDKLDWKPDEKSFTASQLMAHMAGALGVYGNGIATGDWKFKSMREIFVANRRTPSVSLDDAVRILNDNYAEFRRVLGALSEDDFDRGEIDSPQLGRVTRWRAAMLAVEHHVNHKAELFMYLKFLGVPVNTRHLYKR